MQKTKVLFIGATGYIGGAVLAKLLSNTTCSFTVLHRDPSQAGAFESQGLQTVLGSLSDTKTMTQAAFDHDVVFQLADADHLEGTQSLLDGFQKRKDAGLRSILIHNSGTGVLADDAYGNFASDKIYSDQDMSMINQIPDSAPHRNVDKLILSASSGNDKLKTIIVCPPLIYGKGSGKFRVVSQQIPTMISAALASQNNSVYVAGQGKNIWSAVHIDDLANFYAILLSKLLIQEEADGKGLNKDNEITSSISVNQEGYYFVEGGEELNFDRAGTEIANSLSKLKGGGGGNGEGQWKVEHVQQQFLEAKFKKT